MLKLKKPSGFTLVELLVVVVIIGILAAIALPNFIGAQEKAKASSVKSNCHTTQIASESYATDSGGIYAADCSTAKGAGPYLPGGGNSIGGANGNGFTNPCTAKTAEYPVAAGLATAAAITAQRILAPAACKGCTNGQVGYTQATSNGGVLGDCYSVVGADAHGNYLSGTAGGSLVLSNM